MPPAGMYNTQDKYNVENVSYGVARTVNLVDGIKIEFVENCLTLASILDGSNLEHCL